jgi:hypothetical protein
MTIEKLTTHPHAQTMKRFISYLSSIIPGEILFASGLAPKSTPNSAREKGCWEQAITDREFLNSDPILVQEPDTDHDLYRLVSRFR